MKIYLKTILIMLIILTSCTTKSKKTIGFVSQESTYYCGPASLAMILNYHDIDVSQDSIVQLIGVVTDSSNGFSMLDLYDVVEKMNLSPAGYRLESIEGLYDLNYPVIAHYSYEHFVVLIDRPDNGFISIADPADTIQIMSIKDFEDRWSKIVLTIE